MDFSGTLNTTCSFCNQQINLASLDSFDGHHFCNVVCAKLYYDNIQQIKIDMSNYRNLYKTKQLSKLAIDTYEKLNGTIFYMLPISKCPVSSIDERIAARDNYTTVLLRMK